ncbi:melanoma antigen preferentially expressed in tumors-like [Nannospalax galili]|uniref:melanoma antigen preferentially expressed in tumors-like n=1 Tax=Nannospalax galili TaxID=1026970 RepID=UPI0004ED1E22|nr:melanoma antigen preferentially expressed in tumors-like [Nannospalax galili]
MDSQSPATLFALAVQSLLNSEPEVIHALQHIPRRLFVPFFKAAFMGGHKNIITRMVKIWPFTCLHMGTLNVQEPQHELLKAMVESLPVFPNQNSDFRSCELRVLDLRKDDGCKTVCSESNDKSVTCFHACAYSEHSILKRESRCNVVNSESEGQSSRQPMELLVDICLNGTLGEDEFLSFLLSKAKESLGFLHLCCRDLQIYKLCNCKSTLSCLDLQCVKELSFNQASLSEVTKILSQVVQLDKLSLSKITCKSLNGIICGNFTTQLRRMDHLKELNLSFCLTDHLENILSVLPSGLDFLSLNSCRLSHNDFKFLSQCPQVNHLKQLNLSNNRIFSEDCESLHTLLQKVSGTLQHLAIDYCLLTDATLPVLISSISHCSHLRLLRFGCNPITMPMLKRVMQHLTCLMELKYVVYSLPVHCYGIWDFLGRLDPQKFAEVKAEISMMLQVAQRNDMKWITYFEEI